MVIQIKIDKKNLKKKQELMIGCFLVRYMILKLKLPVKTVSRKANWESSPSKNSMKKKSTDHNCEGVMVKMASG